MINTPLELALEIQYTINIEKEKGRWREGLKIYISINVGGMWGVRCGAKDRSLSLQERVSHIYTN